MQWQSHKNLAFHMFGYYVFQHKTGRSKGTLGCPLPALSSCRERAGCRWGTRKVVLFFFSSVQEPCDLAQFLLQGERPLLTSCHQDQPNAELWGETAICSCAELSWLALDQKLATTKDREIQAHLKEIFHIFSMAWFCSYGKDEVMMSSREAIWSDRASWMYICLCECVYVRICMLYIFHMCDYTYTCVCMHVCVSWGVEGGRIVITVQSWVSQ